MNTTFGIFWKINFMAYLKIKEKGRVNFRLPTRRVIEEGVKKRFLVDREIS